MNLISSVGGSPDRSEQERYFGQVKNWRQRLGMFNRSLSSELEDQTIIGIDNLGSDVGTETYNQKVIKIYFLVIFKIVDNIYDSVNLENSLSDRNKAKEDLEFNKIIFKKLIQDNQNIDLVNQKDEDGVNALYWFTKFFDKSLVEFLISNGADINCVCDEKTPLMHAMEDERLDLVELLVSNGADYLNVTDSEGSVFLYKLMKKNNYQAVSYLLKVPVEDLQKVDLMELMFQLVRVQSGKIEGWDSDCSVSENHLAATLCKKIKSKLLPSQVKCRGIVEMTQKVLESNDLPFVKMQGFLTSKTSAHLVSIFCKESSIPEFVSVTILNRGYDPESKHARDERKVNANYQIELAKSDFDRFKARLDSFGDNLTLDELYLFLERNKTAESKSTYNYSRMAKQKGGSCATMFSTIFRYLIDNDSDISDDQKNGFMTKYELPRLKSLKTISEHSKNYWIK